MSRSQRGRCSSSGPLQTRAYGVLSHTPPRLLFICGACSSVGLSLGTAKTFPCPWLGSRHPFRCVSPSLPSELCDKNVKNHRRQARSRVPTILNRNTASCIFQLHKLQTWLCQGCSQEGHWQFGVVCHLQCSPVVFSPCQATRLSQTTLVSYPKLRFRASDMSNRGHGQRDATVGK